MNMFQFLTEVDSFKNQLSAEAQEFLETLKETNNSPVFTENGLKILKCMKENVGSYLNTFSAKQLGELLFMSPRSVSGSMKKLLNENYVKKNSNNPVTYGLTDSAKELNLDNV